MATKISRRGAVEAARDGGDAFRAGTELADCPHKVGGDVGDEFMAHHWVKGWRAASEADQ